MAKLSFFLRPSRIFLLGAILSVAVVGCSKGGSGGSPAPQATTTPEPKVAQETKPPTPVDIVIYSTAGDPVESFDYRYGDSLRKKFPNYNIKYIRSEKGTQLPEMLAGGTSFDLFFHSIGNFENAMLPNGLEYDMTELIKKHNIDLNRIEPTIIDAVKQASGGKLYGLPVSTSNLVMFYNKALFDKFGVSYPKDGMTWDEVIEVAKKMTRNEGGVQYYGLTNSFDHTLKLNPLSIPAVDLKTETPTINTDERWKRIYQLFLTDLAQGSGWQEGMKTLGRVPNVNDFFKEYKVAMSPYLSSLYYAVPEEMKKFDWDMVSMPSFKDTPNIGSQLYPIYFGVTKLSKQQDAAMEIIKYLLSDEYQIEASKKGVMTILQSKSVQDSLGTESPFKGKNFKAMYLNKPAPIAPKALYDAQILTIYRNYGIKHQMGGMDLNTALRGAEEEAKQLIATIKSQSK